MQARSAASFVDSIGVNVHMTYPGVYQAPGRVGRLLGELGVRHVRDGHDGNQRWQPSVIAELYRSHGVKTLLIEDYRAAGLLAQRMADLKTCVAAGMLDGLEGPNEVNSSAPFADYPGTPPAWVQTTADWLGLLRTARDQSYPSVPVVGPSLTNWQAYAYMRDAGLAALEEQSNIHPYPGGNHPSSAAAGLATTIQAEVQRVHGGPFPFLVTETGYHGAYLQPSGHVGVDDDTAAAYVGPLLFEAFLAGALRTYIYELVDEGNDYTRKRQESSFGLAHWGIGGELDLKPAGRTLRNLLRALGAPSNATPAALDVTVTGPVRSLLLHRGDGRYVLALWQTASLWDTIARRKVVPTPSPVTATVTFGQPARLEWVEPRRSSEVEYAASGVTTASPTVGADGPVLLLVDVP